ncbi:hypothetical protein K1719_010470 [Acacia pycnantha]|nr:hypothetical protein K1719_010470 [Acacia pycnantha]
MEAVKKFKVAQDALAQVAWNFVNDGHTTDLPLLQFQPHHFAAGAIFLIAKFLKVKLPSHGEKLWWQEFDVTLANWRVGLGSSANHVEHPASNHGRSNDYGHTEMKHRVEDEAKGYGEEQETNVGRNEMEEAGENVKHSSRNPDDRDSTFGRPPQEVIKKIDRDKLKGTREKRTKASGYITKKTEVMDDDDLIERELEDGIELAAQSDKNKQDQGKTGLSPQLDQIMGMCCLEGTKIIWMSIIMG